MEIKINPQKLIPFLKGIIACFEYLTRQNEVEIELNADNYNIILYFDSEKIAEVMSNLILNSLNYTPAGGRIRISVYQPNLNYVEILLKNNNPGFTNSNKEVKFNCLSQLKNSMLHKEKSFGLNLSLIKKYIKFHGGTISVNGKSVEGAEYLIRLPIGKEHFMPIDIEEQIDMSKDGSDFKRIDLLKKLRPSDAIREKKQSQEIDSSSNTREIVLVVEDNNDMRMLIVNILKKQYEILDAKDGKEGLEIAKCVIPDIIICDVIMPGINGLQLCQHLKSDINTSHIPIILLTAQFSDSVVIDGLKAGADDYIIKPFNIKVLRSRVSNFIQLRPQLQQKNQWQILQRDVFHLTKLEDTFLHDIEKLMEENLSNSDFSLDEKANLFFMSQKNLQRKLIALTGQSPKKLFQSYRLKRALDLLKTNYGNITEIASRVGFSNYEYFIKCFKDTFKQLPTDFYSY